MQTSRRLRFVRVLVALLLAVVVVLTLFDALALELFLGASVVGLLVVFEVVASSTVSAGWHGSVRWVVLAGLAAFGLVVARRMVGMLPPGVL
ncbi:hypothetical protein [Halorussus amylolyticus]|uniref:hypothetical protein n=1 Tax=Halorussus amylolyticus TaxID=1126242 RepID=UPI0010528A44|nr:hypothetical protein [Halorussus amylolyticus]